MKFIVIAIILLFPHTFTASDKAANNNKKNDTKLIARIKHNFNDVAPEKAVLNFLKWYKENQERLKKIEVVRGTPGDATKTYAIDFEKVEEFLLALKKSSYVSDKYISTLMAVFKKCDHNLKMYPQSDGPVSDLEFDIVFGIQEQNEITEHLNEVKILSKVVFGNKASILFGIGKHLRFKVDLTRHANYWLIDQYKPYYI